MLPQEHNQPSIINPVSPAQLPQWHWILVSTHPCCCYHHKLLCTSPDSLSFFILSRGLPIHPPLPLPSLLLCLSTLLQNWIGFFRLAGTFPSTSLISAPDMLATCRMAGCPQSHFHDILQVSSPPKTEATPSAVSSNFKLSSINWIDHEPLAMVWQLSYHCSLTFLLHY